MLKLPKCVRDMILTKYLDFEDLQRVVEYTHIRIPRTQIYSKKYLMSKRKYEEKDAEQIALYYEKGEFPRYVSKKIFNFMAMEGDVEFAELISEYLFKYVVFSNKQITNIAEITSNIIYDIIYFDLKDFLFADESIVIQKLATTRNSIDLIIKILCVRGLEKAILAALHHFPNLPGGDYLEILIENGHMDLALKFIKKLKWQPSIVYLRGLSDLNLVKIMQAVIYINPNFPGDDSLFSDEDFSIPDDSE
jgi:hypothetical protein